jgi:hypothetical protein
MATLPSVRALAAEQGANPLTVAKAYRLSGRLRHRQARRECLSHLELQSGCAMRNVTITEHGGQ